MIDENMIEHDFKKEIEDFCSTFGIAVAEVENRISEIKPDTGNYFDATGSKTGTLMPFYFSAVSLIIKHATNVLEIGTGFGRTTALLARLFPSATIYTIDNLSSDKDYAKLGRGVGNEETFERDINKGNIRFIRRDSFFLPSMGLPREFDLIYVDGGHKYPVVAWDAMFAYNRLRSGGFVFFHDYRSDGETDIEPTIKYMKDIIGEEIKMLPSDMTPDIRKVAWFRKSANERELSE